MRQTLILTALHFEAVAIARRLRLQFVARTDAAGDGVRLHIVGPRATFLPSNVTPANPSRVILAGLSGGLTADAPSVLLDDRSAAVSIDLHRAPVTTVAAIAATPAEKQALHESTRAVAADMESDLVRAWADSRGLEFVNIRAISDGYDETLDPATLRIVDAAGFLSVGRLLREVAARPAFVATLWRLRRTGERTAALADAVARVVAADQ